AATCRNALVEAVLILAASLLYLVAWLK
ncbi:hypothetical protein A2U01_0109972, partial [Trifolium medium]|nr:hypothetical protein [Trifolium medium]